MKQRYVTTNGIRIFLVEEGEGPLVVLCHGFPEYWHSWSKQLPALADAGFRAVAVDMPGYGRSDKPDVKYDIEFLSACLAGIPDALGHDRMAVAGHDWGGLVVWPFARFHPELLAGVIGVNTPDLPRTPVPPLELLRKMNPEQPYYIVQFQEPGAAEAMIYLDVDKWFELMLLGPMTTQRQVFTQDVLRAYADQFRPIGAATPPLDYYRNMDRNWELTEKVADQKVETPALMIMAENDLVLRPQLAEGMEARVPNLTKVLIKECGHWTQVEQPEATNKALIDFLSGLEPWD